MGRYNGVVGKPLEGMDGEGYEGPECPENGGRGERDGDEDSSRRSRSLTQHPKMMVKKYRS